MITGVAISQDGVVWALPKPFRHHDVIHLIVEKTGQRPVTGVQGFIADFSFMEQPTHFCFLDREQALYHARRMGQVTDIIGSILTSEDLW